MRLRPGVVLPAALVIGVAMACGSSVTSPTTTGTSGLGGTWRGTGLDSQGSTIVTWTLSQTGANVSGTVKTQAVDQNDGSCGSCHRNKSGTFTGAIDGTTLRLTMFFAAGVDGDPTPACTATLSGTASTAAANQMTAVYAGEDSCEGPFLNGNLPMTRQP